MSKNVPWDSVPDNLGNVLDTNLYKFEIEQMEETATKEAAKYMIKATYVVVEPEGDKGRLMFDNFVIGTNDDPSADDPKSWTGISAARWKDVLVKANVPTKGTTEEVCFAAKGAQFLADVVQEVDNKPGQYQGTVRNKIKKTYRVGERTVGGAGVAMANAASAPQARPFRPGTAVK